MKNWNRVLSLLLVLVLLTGCTVPSVGEQTEPTESTGPKRPDDPGVIAPLEDDTVIPENGVLWDMESLPDIMTGTPWAVAQYGDHDDYVADRVQLLGADGKGYEGSRALAVRQNGNYSWSDIFTIGYKKDKTAIEKWTFGEILWIWYDSTELAGNLLLELKLNGNNMSMGLPYYVMDENGTEAKRAGLLPEAYTGAGYGRIPLVGGGKYWVGVPMEAFGSDRKVNSLGFHLSGAALGSVETPLNLYLDQFCLTAADEGPMGAALSTVSAKQASSDAPAWTMDELPEDLLAAYWANHDGAGWDTYVAGNIRILGVDGKGVDGSRALQVKQVGKYNGADVFSVNMTSDPAALTDWTGQTMLWFWADTTELTTDLTMDISIDGHKAAIGAAYYGINKDGQTEQAGKLELAWQGADYGRMRIGKGFAGWVGIPMSAFGGNLTEVTNLSLHMAYGGDASANIGRSVYLDELWVTKENEQPKNAKGGDIKILTGTPGSGSGNTDSASNADVGPAIKLPAEVWSMEYLPKNVLNGWLGVAQYPTHADYKSGNVTIVRANGEGVDGSTAMALTHVGPYNWSDTFNLNLPNDSTAKRNWAGGKYLWFHVDTTAYSAAVGMDLWCDQAKPASGSVYYLIADGASDAEAKVAPEAYTGAGFARFSIPGGFSGWVGIALKDYEPDVTKVNVLSLHTCPDGSDYQGKTMYLDAFWVTADETAPNGVTFTPVSTESVPATSDKAAWDMENLPADLQSENWAVCDHASNEQFIPGNVSLLGVDGMGRGGSRALKIAFNGDYHWADVWTLQIRKDLTAATDWTEGEMIWFFVNGTELKGNVELELVLNKAKPNAAAGLYTVVDGAPVKLSELITAWDGNGRIAIQKGYVGWLGIPKSAYTGVDQINTIDLHFGNVSNGSAVYLDELWVTKLNEVPVNAENSYIEGGSEEPEEKRAQIWSFDDLPTDWKSKVVTGDSAAVGDHVDAVALHGWGVNGSTAMGYLHKETNWTVWSYYLDFQHADQLGMAHDWNGYEMVWFWVNANHTKNPILLDIKFDGKGPAVGAEFYLWSGSGEPTLGGTLPDAWGGGANYGRISVPAGYVGYIGLKIADYTDMNLSGVYSCYIYATNGNTNEPAVIVFDDFWLTSGGMLPDPKASQPSTNTSEDPTPKPDPKPETKPSIAGQAWDMEQLPADLVAAGWASAPYGSSTVSGNLTLTAAEGKGHNGTQALAITPVGDYHWADVYDLDLTKDTTATTDWSGSGILWMWVDASEFPVGLSMEIEAGSGLKFDEDYYRIVDGKVEVAGKTFKTWDGATLGRVAIPAGYVGWLGIPMTAFNTAPTNVSFIRCHVGYDGDGYQGKHLYLDALTLTAADKAPDNATFPAPEPAATPKPEEVQNAALVWDMENVPDNAASWGMDRWDGYPAISSGSMTASGVNGKGVDGSRALGWGQTGNEWYFYSYMVLANDGSAVTNWAGATDLYFYVNASEFDQGANVDVFLHAGGGEYEMKAGAPYQYWQGGGWVDATIGEWKHMYLPAGFMGWIRLPIADVFGTPDISKVERIGFYREYYGTAGNIYFDHFCVGTTKTAEPEPTGTRQKIWDFEALPDDMSTQVTTAWGGQKLGEHVDAVKAAGKGVGGSTALGYKALEASWDGNYLLQMDHADQMGMVPDWGNAEMIWFWVDATELTADTQLDLWFSWCKPATGATYYLWNGSGAPVEGGTLPEAYGGAGFGRIPVQAGYKGYIGLKVADYAGLNTSGVYGCLLYYPSGNFTTVPATLYLDDFWITTGTMLPQA